MTREEFGAYIADYNSHDPERLGRHFDPGLVFENFGGHHAGAEAFAFLAGLHQQVCDTMVIQQLLVDGDRIAMEALSTVTAIGDAPDLPIGPMRKGDRVIMRMFAFYRTRGPLITHIKVSGWPPVATNSPTAG